MGRVQTAPNLERRRMSQYLSLRLDRAAEVRDKLRLWSRRMKGHGNGSTFAHLNPTSFQILKIAAAPWKSATRQATSSKRRIFCFRSETSSTRTLTKKSTSATK